MIARSLPTAAVCSSRGTTSRLPTVLGRPSTTVRAADASGARQCPLKWGECSAKSIVVPIHDSRRSLLVIWGPWGNTPSRGMLRRYHAVQRGTTAPCVFGVFNALRSTLTPWTQTTSPSRVHPGASPRVAINVQPARPRAAPARALRWPRRSLRAAWHPHSHGVAVQRSLRGRRALLPRNAASSIALPASEPRADARATAPLSTPAHAQSHRCQILWSSHPTRMHRSHGAHQSINAEHS